jgi:hypothetical protein
MNIKQSVARNQVKLLRLIGYNFITYTSMYYISVFTPLFSGGRSVPLMIPIAAR